LALLDESAAREILLACDVELDKLRADLQQYLSSHIPQLVEPGESQEVTQTLGSNASSSAQFSMYSPPANGKCPAPMYWWRFSARKTAMAFILLKNTA